MSKAKKCKIRGCGKPVRAKALCEQHYRAAHYEANKEKITSRKKAYYEKNKEKIKVRREANKEKFASREKAYREKNKEKIASRKKAYYEKNKEKFASREKAYREKNKEKIAARRIARLRTFEGMLVYMWGRMHDRTTSKKQPAANLKLYYGRYCPPKEEFLKKARRSKKLRSLYDAWVSSGFKKDMKPSPDRVCTDPDPSRGFTGGYELDNIRFITWGENLKLAHEKFKANRRKAAYDVAGKSLHVAGQQSVQRHLKPGEKDAIRAVAGNVVVSPQPYARKVSPTSTRRPRISRTAAVREMTKAIAKRRKRIEAADSSLRTLVLSSRLNNRKERPSK